MDTPSLKTWIERFKNALQIEVACEREQGGRGYKVLDGYLLERGPAGAVYIFRLELDAILPDDAPVRVEVDGEKVKGSVISSDGYDVTLELERAISDFIPEATLFCEPWEILEAIIKRLEVVEKELRGNACLALASLGLENDTKKKASQLVIKKGADEAIRLAFTEPVTYIWGPPGTGKTEVLARIAAEALRRDYRVLITSHANVAVDGALLRLAKFCEKESHGLHPKLLKGEKIIRYGHPKLREMREHPYLFAVRVAEKRYPKLRKLCKRLEEECRHLRQRVRVDRSVAKELAFKENELAEIRRQLRKEEEEIARRARVLGVTLSKAAVDAVVYENKYDMVLLDEVSMAGVPHAFYAASLADKYVVFLGDFYQLPLIATAKDPEVERWIASSLYDYLNFAEIVKSRRWHPQLVILDEQRRMHPQISGFIEVNVYGGLLKNHPSVAEKRSSLVAKKPFANSPLALIDASSYPCYCYYDDEESRFNLGSALLCITLYQEALDDEVSSVGLIAPYRAQGRLLSWLLRELFPGELRTGDSNTPFASTVHRFQGGERDFIIFDYTDGPRLPRVSRLLSSTQKQQDIRLLNVAVSRARAKLITVANVDFLMKRLSKQSIHHQFLQYLREKGTVFNSEDIAKFLTERKIGHAGALFWPSKRKAVKNWLAELATARKSVNFGLYPEMLNVKKLKEILLQLEKKGVSVQIMVPKGKGEQAKRALPSDWSGRIHEGFVGCPILIVDQEILWYAPPVEEALGLGSCGLNSFGHFCARLVAPQIMPRMSRLLKLGRPLSERGKEWEKFLRESYRCSNCGAALKVCSGKRGYPFLGCSSFPYCREVRYFNEGIVQEFLDSFEYSCPECGAPLKARRNRKNNELFAGCVKYPECRYTISLKNLLR